MVIIETNNISIFYIKDIVEKLKSLNIKTKPDSVPPKEYKSSPYKVWIHVIYTKDPEQYWLSYESVRFYCRDEETAVVVNLVI